MTLLYFPWWDIIINACKNDKLPPKGTYILHGHILWVHLVVHPWFVPNAKRFLIGDVVNKFFSFSWLNSTYGAILYNFLYLIWKIMNLISYVNFSCPPCRTACMPVKIFDSYLYGKTILLIFAPFFIFLCHTIPLSSISNSFVSSF